MADISVGYLHQFCTFDLSHLSDLLADFHLSCVDPELKHRDLTSDLQ